MFLDINHRPVFILNNVSDTKFCLCLQVKVTEFGPIGRASPYLRTPVPNTGQGIGTSKAQHKPSAKAKTNH
jgi:hypothetical protein